MQDQDEFLRLNNIQAEDPPQRRRERRDEEDHHQVQRAQLFSRLRAKDKQIEVMQKNLQQEFKDFKDFSKDQMQQINEALTNLQLNLNPPRDP